MQQQTQGSHGHLGDEIRRKQADWAESQSIQTTAAGYTATLEQNLHTALSPETMADYARGSGAEMKSKMLALHSSSALVCNVFEYWRGRELAPLQAVLASCIQAPGPLATISMEQTFATGLRGIPPTLDVVLRTRDGWALAIESKFCEPYGAPHCAAYHFAQSYLGPSDGQWAARGLPRCQDLARQIQAGRIFLRLGAPQLLKHILGLRATCGDGFGLLYLWYDVPHAPEAVEHQEEINQFRVAVEGEVRFDALSYQELFRRLACMGSVDQTYVHWLKQRYA